MGHEVPWTFKRRDGRLTARRDLDGWTVIAELGDPETVTRLTVGVPESRSIPRGGITGAVLRRIGLPAMLEEYARLGEAESLRLDQDGSRARLLCRTPGKRARGTHKAMVRALFAEVYSQLLEDGVSDPAAAIAGQLDKTPEAVRNTIARARDAGYLTPTAPGKRGGELTREGRELADRAWDIYGAVLSLSERPAGLPDTASVLDVLRWWEDTIGIDRESGRAWGIVGGRIVGRKGRKVEQ